MTSAREMNVEQGMSILIVALRDIVGRNDCDYADAPEEDRHHPCPCPRCVAEAALEMSQNWRFKGAHCTRVEHNPRELAIVQAWAQFMDDRKLGQLLSEAFDPGESVACPSPRDWFVATSVVQWLATNVGSSILEAAGFKYTRYEEDRKVREARAAKKDKGGP